MPSAAHQTPDRSAPRVALARPSFRTLLPEECAAVLERGSVGRLAYVLHGEVGIVPLHYVHADGWLYGRTGSGEKLAALRSNPWVAFEVDEIDGPFDWRSVVVRGAFYRLTRDGPLAERARWERAAAALRTLVPAALTDADPTPQRDVLFRIHLGQVTGRAAETRAPEGVTSIAG